MKRGKNKTEVKEAKKGTEGEEEAMEGVKIEDKKQGNYKKR